MRQQRLLLVALCIALLTTVAGSAQQPFEVKDGDRIVLLGSTIIEREQRYGYWETMLISRHPGKRIVVRNLGWSGDTVFGHARAGFGSVADGFRKLKEDVGNVKPTLILVGYGANESFAGADGLPKFEKGLHTLLDALAPTNARITLLSPMQHENLGPPLPKVQAQNENLRSYAKAIREVAQKRELAFVDVLDLIPEKVQGDVSLTDNGLHLTDFGYWKTAFDLRAKLKLPVASWMVDVGADGTVHRRQGVAIKSVKTKPLQFEIRDVYLTAPPIPKHFHAVHEPKDRVLRVRNLAPGKHDLFIDGKLVHTATAAQWNQGVPVASCPGRAQAEKLRNAVVEKNRLFFHRWRPQNVTYLYGFRKHEQGNNAKEIPLFDPIIDKKEQEIARLAQPAMHRYELRPHSEEKK